ncbi:MAG: hypothetical protein GX096_01420 [Clostridiales bacterium]|nr:hypothetical protein [Clostridiales bacterium]
MRTATIYNFLIEATIIASIAILLMIFIRKFLRKQLGNTVIYFAWLLIAIRLLCPIAFSNPLINDIRPAYQQDQAIRPIAGQIQIRMSDAAQAARWRAEDQSADPDNDAVVEKLNDLVDLSFNGLLSRYVMQLYLAGMALVALYFITANVLFRYRLRSDRIEKLTGELLDQYNALCYERGIKPLPVYFTDPLASACLVGVVHPYIAMPLTATPQEVTQVLAHEICHYQGKDHIWGALRLLCCLVHWFNPLVWLGASMSKTDTELACDDRVIRPLDSKERLSYANVLVLAASKRTAPGTAILATNMTMTGKKLKTRVDGIIHQRNITKALSIAFVSLAGIALLLSFATAEYVYPIRVPSIVGSYAVGQPTITSEEDSIAYLKAVAATPYLNAEVSEADYQANVSYGTYTLHATTDTQSNLTMTVGPQGRISSLINHAVDAYGNYHNAFFNETEYVDDAKNAEIVTYIKGFMRDIQPDALPAMSEPTLYREWTENGGKPSFVSYNAYSASGSEKYFFCVQLLPTVQLAEYTVSTVQP